MKKYLLFLGIIGLFALTACGKQAKMSDVTIDYGSSSIYSKEDMDALWILLQEGIVISDI